MATNIDLKSLLDLVLGMARESMELRKRNAGASWYGGNKDEEEYWKDIRKRNTALELQRETNKGLTDVQGLKNTGSLATQESENSGALARQELASRYGLEGTKYTADQSLTGHLYQADRTAESAKNTGDSELIKAAGAVAGNLTLPIEETADARNFLKSRFAGMSKEASPAMPESRFAGMSKEASPAMPELSQPSVISPRPREFDVPDKTPQNPVAGAKSMEFRRPGSVSPAEEALRKKKSEERLLFGTKPQSRSWF